jgi:hypothetical protein
VESEKGLCTTHKDAQSVINQDWNPGWMHDEQIKREENNSLCVIIIEIAID